MRKYHNLLSAPKLPRKIKNEPEINPSGKWKKII